MADTNRTTNYFDVDITNLKAAMQEAKRAVNQTQAEFRTASAELELFGQSSDGVQKQVDALKGKLEGQQKILANLKTEYERVKESAGENSASAAKLALQIQNQETAILKTTKSIQDYEGKLENVQQAEAMTAQNGKSVEENLEEIAKSAKEAGEAAKEAGDGFTVLKAVAADLIANGVMSLLDGLKALGDELIDVGKKAVSGYAEYEQLVGGIDTLFGEASEKVQGYADDAYKTSGMSANKYMETVTSFSAALIQSQKNNVAQLSDDEIKIRSEALDVQYENQQKAYEKQYNAQKKAYDNEYSQLQKTLSAQYDEKKEAFDNEYNALSDSLDAEIEAVQKANEKRLSEAEKSYEADVSAFEKATEEKIALIDKEYRENLKLIDEEKYNQLKAIDEQIAQIEAQTEAERKAQEEAENEQKRAELQKAVNTAQSAEERKKAQQSLNDFEAKLVQKAREEQRKTEIAGLKEQKETIKETSDARKEAAKEQYDEAVTSAKEASKEQLAAMKESHNEEISAMKESQKEELEALKDSKKEQLAELKKAQTDELAAVKEAQQAQLSAVKESQQAQLESLKEFQSTRLKEQKKAIDTQKDALKEVNDSAAGSVELTKEQLEAAADIAEMAMEDMSDNANKMGSSMDSIMNAYQGFAKGQYQLLDNLKLGYGGTKTEMERLLADAEKITGVKYDISNLEDIYTAIHVIQEEMGITGTTSEEAATTIEGSFNMMQAAWENLLVGMANPDADFDKLFSNFAESAMAYLNNIMPVAENVINGIANFILQAAPVIGEQLPIFIANVLPQFIQAGAALLGAIGTGIIQNLPLLLESAIQIVTELATGLGQAMPDLIPAAIDIIIQIVETLIDNIDLIIDAGVELLLGLIEGIINALPKLVAKAPEIVQKLIEALQRNAPKLVNAAITIIQMLTEFLLRDDIIGMLINAQIEITQAIVNALIDNAPQLLDAAIQIISALAAGLILYVVKLTEKAPEIIETFVKSFDGAEIIKKLHDAGWAIIDYLAKGIADTIIIAKDWGEDFVKGLWNGISNMAAWIKEKIQGFGEDVLGALKDFFGIHSPSTVMRDIIGKNLVAGLADGIDDNEKTVLNSVKGLAGDMKKTLQNDLSGAMESLDFTGGLSLDMSDIKNRLAGAAAGISAANGTSDKVVNNTYNFTQNNTSPKALSRLEIYRQTRNQFTLVKGAFG